MTDYRDRIATVFFTNLPSFPDAECRNVDDPDIFFPHPTDERAIWRAKSHCQPCTHRFECLTYALEHEIEHGVFGALTPEERQAIKPRSDRRKSKQSAAVEQWKHLQRNGFTDQQIEEELGVSIDSIKRYSFRVKQNQGGAA